MTGNKAFSKVHIFIFLILFVMISLTGCRQEDKYISFLRYGLAEAPASLDPALVQDAAGRQLLGAVYEGLLRQKPDGTYEAAMAGEWSMEEAGLKYIFKIRDAVWSDGSPVTAQDFVFAWKRALDPQNRSPYAYLLYDIKNAEGYHRAGTKDYYGAAATADEVSVYAPDEATLVVELRQPDTAFFKKLVHPVFFPLPQGLVQELGKAYFAVENMAANGPFIPAEQSPEGALVLNKNIAYWDAENVSLPGIVCYFDNEKQDTWRMFEEGRLDLTLTVPQAELEEQQKENRLFVSPLLANYYYQFNTAKTPLQDKRVRQALSLALDRKQMVEEILRGAQRPAQGLIPHFAAENPAPDNNPAEAQRLLAEAGFTAESFPALELLVAAEESHLYLAEYLKNQWQEKLGITVNITPLDPEARRMRLLARDYDLALAGWFVDYDEKAEFLESFVFRLGQNTSGWSNAHYDALVKAARTSLTEEERLTALQQAEIILMADLPVLPLYDYTRAYVQQGRVEGFYVPPAGLEAEFKWVRIKTL
ncbi:MAG: peptide ABC transporter substrate-binding protein [Clostridia bacterium]|jgi:oligopeptide transport system substrate-binding protein|nr:peptide ABC transporter substrate-binding protein [Clostridia bacterium]